MTDEITILLKLWEAVPIILECALKENRVLDVWGDSDLAPCVLTLAKLKNSWLESDPLGFGESWELALIALAADIKDNPAWSAPLF